MVNPRRLLLAAYLGAFVAMLSACVESHGQFSELEGELDERAGETCLSIFLDGESPLELIAAVDSTVGDIKRLVQNEGGKEVTDPNLSGAADDDYASLCIFSGGQDFDQAHERVVMYALGPGRSNFIATY